MTETNTEKAVRLAHEASGIEDYEERQPTVTAFLRFAGTMSAEELVQIIARMASSDPRRHDVSKSLREAAISILETRNADRMATAVAAVETATTGFKESTEKLTWILIIASALALLIALIPDRPKQDTLDFLWNSGKAIIHL